MTFEQRPEENSRNSFVSVWGQDILGRESYLCKGFVAGVSLDLDEYQGGRLTETESAK